MLCNPEVTNVQFFGFIDISCPLLESDLAYSDDDVPSVYDNGLSQKSSHKAKDNFNFLHLNRYIFLANQCFACVNFLKIDVVEKVKNANQSAFYLN